MKVRYNEQRGKWIADWTDAFGKRRQTSHDQRQEAQDKVDEARREARLAPRRQAKIDPRMLLEDYAGKVLDERASSLAPKSLNKYQGNLVNHVFPKLGNMPLVDLDRELVKRFIIEKRDDPRGNARTKTRPLHKNSLKHILIVLQFICEEAVRAGILAANPVVGVARELFGRTKRLGRNRESARKVHVMDAVQLRAFLESAKRLKGKGDIASYDVLFTISETGMRLGELLGLRPNDVDLEGRRIRVERQATGSTKTESSERWIEVSSGTVEFLRGVLAKRREVEFRGKTGGWLFAPRFPTNPTDSQVNGEQAKIRRDMVLACQHAGLSRMTPHILRHTWASRAVSGGYPLEWVRRQLGHASIKITIDYYGRWLPMAAPAGAVEALSMAVRNVQPV